MPWLYGIARFTVHVGILRRGFIGDQTLAHLPAQFGRLSTLTH
jgi:hypothetical protein